MLRRGRPAWSSRRSWRLRTSQQRATKDARDPVGGGFQQMKQQVLVFCALLSLIFSPVVALGRPLVASAAAADPMFQVQVPGVFKQKAFPVDATAGKSVPGVVTLADAESAFAGRGGLAASASGSLGSIFTPGAMAINLFTGGSSRAEFRLPDVTFSGSAPDLRPTQ